jgi:hypothetical protein
MTDARLEELLDRDVTDCFSDEEVDLLRHERPAHFTSTVVRLGDLFAAPGWELRPEVAYLFARFKSRPDEPADADQLLLDLALVRILPRSLAHYREADAAARRPKRALVGGVRK